MFGFLILLVILVAVMKHRHLHRHMDLENSCWGGRRKRYFRFRDHAETLFEHKSEKLDRKMEKLGEKLEERAERFRKHFEKHAEKFDKHAEAFERKAGLEPPEVEEKQYQTYEERKAYRRARKQASREAGFYVHLIVYSSVIGFLFLINLLTSTYPWFLWPALGWGFGIFSHFMAVYGWRYVRQRVFEPAVQREVQREVLHEKEVLHTEKQASLDELTATFAHEIRNPIAAAKSLVQQMGEDPTSHENVEYAKVALEELARVERSVSHLLKYAKEEDYRFDNVNLAAVLDSALTQLRNKLEAQQVSVSRNYLGGPMIRADADKLRQVFSNIIDNAVDALSGLQAERKLELAIHNNKSTGNAVVQIKDNGCGISEDKLSKIFNPFYTSKSNGTGLGMAVAKKIVEAHRGRIEVQSAVGEGTEFEITLPLSDAIKTADLEGTGEELRRPVSTGNGNGGTSPTMQLKV